MNTKNIPAIIMLAAGLVSGIVMVLQDIDNREFCLILLLVLVVFYCIGCVVKVVLDRNIVVMAEEEAEETPERSAEMEDISVESDETEAVNTLNEEPDSEEETYEETGEETVE